MRRRSTVERAMQRACGLPDERQPADTGWREGANGTRYMRVTFEADMPPVDKSGQSLHMDNLGNVYRPVRFSDGESLADPLDYDRLN